MNLGSTGYVACLASLLATACGGSAAPVTAPSQRNLFPGVEPITKVFVGSVLDGDDATPIPGAALGLFPPAATPAMSDSLGHYSLTIAAYNVSLGFLVDVTKAGYEEALEFAPFSAGDRYDFKLFRPITIPAGSSTSISITEDNALCNFVNGEFEDEFRCRAVNVQAASDGVLTVATSPVDSADPYFIHVGTPHDLQYPFQGQTRVQQPVTAGTIITLQIMRPWYPTPSGRVTVETSFVPRP